MVQGGDIEDDAAMKAAIEGECRSQSDAEKEQDSSRSTAQVFGNMFGEGTEDETSPADDESYGDGGEPGMGRRAHPAHGG